MKVIHLSVECFPVAKVGGLADVIGALPKFQRQLGIDAAVVMPWYNRAFTQANLFDLVAEGSFTQGATLMHYEVLKEQKDQLGFPLYLIRIPGLLDREEVYGYADQDEQWIAFQHAFLTWIKTQSVQPDLIHCHDHHVGLTAFLMHYAVAFKELATIKTIFTVHNGQYQGWMSWNKTFLLPEFDTWKWGLLDWNNLINPMGAAIKCSDAFTTVSTGYLKELYVEANGLETLFRAEAQKGYGIVNGIDPEYWNPLNDDMLIANYAIADVKHGKSMNKKALCNTYGLNPELPLLCFIGRFAFEKGADLLAAIVESILTESENKLSIFILGSGDQAIQNSLTHLVHQHEGQFAAFFGYNEKLAHQVYAASDMLLMPSRIEPCGLNQLYALKYGTIPIVNAVGGLKDTILDVSTKEGYGIVFQEAQVDVATAAIMRALVLVEDENLLASVRKKEMNLDFSWGRSAQKYLDLYTKLLNEYVT